MKLLLKSGMLGTGRVCEHDIKPGTTAREAVLANALPEWEGLAVGIALNGRKLEAEELDTPLPQGSHLVAGPLPQGTIIGDYLIVALISAAVSYAIYALTPKPKPPGVPQENDDDRSPTKGFGGIRTTYGQGHLIPVVMGEHDVGGHVAHTEVVADSIDLPFAERARFVLVLSEGEVESIGGVRGGATGEFNRLGGFRGGASGGILPENIRINNNRYEATTRPGVMAWGRMGRNTQHRLPAPFVGAGVTEVVGERLEQRDTEVRFTISDEGSISVLAMILEAPAGIYRQGAQGPVPYPITLTPRWRPVGDTAWRQFQRFGGANQVADFTFGASVVATRRFVATVNFWFRANGAPISGPIEVLLERQTLALGTSQGVDGLLWRQVQWRSPHVFTYPGRSVLGLEVEASDKVSGGQPQFKIRQKGIRVRCWDETNGWSDYGWEVPASPHNYYSNPIGRNPAWLAVEFILARWGLGRQFGEADIDLQRFAEWAIYCDDNPGLWTEPRYCFDGVLDHSQPAWEWLQTIAAAGHAVVYMKGSQISVAYRYRDAHSAGPIAVPSKQRAQLFSAPALRNLKTSWLPIADRPTVFDYQFLNEEKEYAGDNLPVADPDADFGGSFNPTQPKKEAVQLFGVTRPSQLFRMGLFEHRINRMAYKMVEFEVPWFGLAAEIGDVVGVQSDWLLPYANTAQGLTVVTGGAAVTTVTLDHDLVIESGKTYTFLVRTPDGGVDEANITNAADTYFAGDNITLDAAVDCDSGAIGVVGVQNQVVEDYEIVHVERDEDLNHKIRAILWVPDAYDIPDPSTFDDASGPESEASTVSEDLAQNEWATTSYQVPGADIDISRDVHGRGWLIAFARPFERHGGPARVFIKTEGVDAWAIQRDTAESQLLVEGLRAHETIQAAVVLASREGVFAPVNADDVATLVVPEFPSLAPPRVNDLVLGVVGDGFIRLEWAPVSNVDTIEIRRGARWTTAKVVAVLPPDATEWTDTSPPPHSAGSSTYWAAARRAGQHSPEWTNAQDYDGASLRHVPMGTTDRVLLDVQVSASPAGTLDDLEHVVAADWDPAGFTHTAGKTQGSYTTDEIALEDDDATEFEAEAYWAVDYDLFGRDVETVDDADFAIDSGEAMFRAVDIRPASVGRPGISTLTVDGIGTNTIEQFERYRYDLLDSSTRVGEAGRRLFVLLESRFYSGGFWGSWETHRDQRRVASRIQVRATVVRESLDVVAILDRLLITAHL